jgi:cell division septum initiation protein DivIVA
MTAIADATDSSTVKNLIQAVEDLQETVERQAERIDELEDELAKHKDHAGREIADVRSRITDLEEQNQETQPGSDDATPGVDAVKSGSQTAETPLERICALPEHVADRELTANQERARFIARDVRDYAEKAPAGLVIGSRAIKRVLTASEGKRPHTQTVACVMDFLDELGKDGVELIKRRGRRMVVVDPEAADRLANHNRCDRGGGTTPGEDVIGPA